MVLLLSGYQSKGVEKSVKLFILKDFEVNLELEYFLMNSKNFKFYFLL